ncbi:8550_t:CDS:2, partial [Racocetra persica]
MISSHWYSEESLALFDKKKIREPKINIRNAIELDSKKVSYSYGFRLCKKALNIAITNGSNKLIQENNNFSISNPYQYKGKGHLANKRSLLAIKNYNSTNIVSSNQDKILASGSKKKNKH